MTLLTIVLNGVLLWKVGQGRELDLRRDLAAELSQALALRAQVELLRGGPPELGDSARWGEVLAGAGRPGDVPWFAVITLPNGQVLADRGPWPVGDEPAARLQWMTSAVDLREAVVSRRTSVGEWVAPQQGPFSRVHAVASTPVMSKSGPLAVIRVSVPAGSRLLGPLDRRTLPWFGLSIILSVVSVGALGLFLFRRRILAPIAALAESTGEIARGHFETRLPVAATKELGELSAAFNDMAAALQRFEGENQRQLAEMGAINEDLRQTREDLIFAEKMASVGRLAAGVAHEVGNPLAAVMGFVDLLLSDEDGSLAPDFLPRIRAELDRIHGIIGDLLEFDRPSVSTTRAVAWVPLVASVVAARQSVEAQMAYSGVRFAVELEPELPRVRAHAGRLQQVLLNLFLNAAQAMGGEGTISVRASEVEGTPERLSVRIEDTGPGIDPKQASTIFEPFFTTKEVGSGTGLGLSVSLRLVEEMGGRLRARRDVVVGACFELILPAEPPPPPAPEGDDPGGEVV